MKWLKLVVIACLLTGCAVDPHRYVEPRTTPVQPTTAYRSTVPPTPGPLPTPKPLTVTIYVVNKNVDSNWSLQEAVNSWQKAKFTDIKLVKSCPADWNIPCVTISMTDSLPTKYAGETNFGRLPNQMWIHLSSTVAITGREKETTVCHEIGHTLGLGHVYGSRNSCMFDGNYYRKFPMVATGLDLKLVDQLGAWEYNKMYDSSGKDIDIRNQPR